MTTRATLRRVNAALKAAGHPEELVRGGDRYFYFAGGAASSWVESGVYGYNLGDLTVEAWVRERDRLAAEDAERR